MIKQVRKKIKKSFRELLIYHNNSLEYRAKLLTLMVAVNHEISPCEEKLLYLTACEIYENDEERAEILVEAVLEYFDKIVSNQSDSFNSLIARQIIVVFRHAVKIIKYR